MSLEQALCLLERLRVIVVAIDLRDDFDALVLVVRGDLVLHELDPRVLVGGVCRRRKDGYLAGTADLVGDHVEHGDRNLFGLNLVDEQVSAICRAIGVEGDDLCASLTCILKRRAYSIGVIRGNHEDIRACLHLGVDEGDLRGGGRLERANDVDLGEADLARSVFAAAEHDVGEGVVQLLGDERNRLGGDVVGAGGIAAGARLAALRRGPAAAGGHQEGRGQRECAECGHTFLHVRHRCLFLSGARALLRGHSAPRCGIVRRSPRPVRR